MKKLISAMLAMVLMLSCALCALAEPVALTGGLTITAPVGYTMEYIDSTDTYTWSKDYSVFAVQVLDLDEYGLTVLFNILGADYLVQYIASSLGTLTDELTEVDMGKGVSCYAFTYDDEGIETSAAMIQKGSVIYVLVYVDISGTIGSVDIMRNEILANWVSMNTTL